MSRVDAGIDHRDDAVAVSLELTLRFGDADDLCRRLCDISAPHRRPEVIDGRRVGEGWRNRWRRVAAALDSALQIDFSVHDAQLQPQRVEERVQRNAIGSGDQEHLARRIAEPVVHVAAQQKTDCLDE